MLVFPLVMLMQTMAVGGMGGGISSAVARALGAGRRDEANALALHGLLIAVVALAVLFKLGLVLGGPALYAAMGGRGATLEAALAYSNVVFGTAIVSWLLATLSNIVRGTGHMLLPASVSVSGAALQMLLSPALVLGWGPFPRLGATGAAIAMVTVSVLGCVPLASHLLSGRGLVSLRAGTATVRWASSREILRVGAPSAVNNVLTSLTVVLLTALVGRLGPATLAGYGMGARLEYLQIPLVFGVGSALVAMVGTALKHARESRSSA